MALEQAQALHPTALRQFPCYPFSPRLVRRSLGEGGRAPQAQHPYVGVHLSKLQLANLATHPIHEN